MTVRVRVPIGVSMAVLLSSHLAVLVAVLAAGRDILLRNVPTTAQSLNLWSARRSVSWQPGRHMLLAVACTSTTCSPCQLDN